MKKTGPVIFLAFILFACSNRDKNAPDVSGIKTDIKLLRFDRDFFALDTNNLEAGLEILYQKYPVLTPVFLQNILALDSLTAHAGIKRFLGLSRELSDTINDVFRNTNSLEAEFEKGLRYVKYYFPNYPVPDIITVAGPVDALAQNELGPTPNFLRPGFIGVSLQFYLGRNFSIYQDPYFIDKVAPAFRSRRFSPEYIAPDAMQLVVNDLFPDQAGGKPLVDQMIERGKNWYLLDKFLPFLHDTLKTGYTTTQLNWCIENEGLIWSYIVKSEDLHSLNPSVIQVYIGEGPFTQGFSQEYSPGNLGPWIGWQIIKKYAAKHPEKKPGEIMVTPAAEILDEAKYKPK